VLAQQPQGQLQTAQEYKKNTQIQATNTNTSKRSNKLHIKITALLTLITV
jgi:hypothetical protein